MRTVDDAGITRISSVRRAVPLPDHYALARREAVYRWAALRCLAEGRRRVLDLGSGDGWGTAILAAHGIEVVGVDQATSVEAASRAYPKVVFRAGDLPTTREPRSGYDAVVCLNLIEGLPDPRPLLDEIRLLLRDGGLAIVATPNRLTNSPGRTRPIAPDRAWEYTSDELHHLVHWKLSEARMLGVTHGARLRRLERIVGEPLPVLLHRLPPADRAAWLRLTLRLVSARDFVIQSGAGRDALDLVAVAVA